MLKGSGPNPVSERRASIINLDSKQVFFYSFILLFFFLFFFFLFSFSFFSFLSFFLSPFLSLPLSSLSRFSLTHKQKNKLFIEDYCHHLLQAYQQIRQQDAHYSDAITLIFSLRKQMNILKKKLRENQQSRQVICGNGRKREERKERKKKGG